MNVSAVAIGTIAILSLTAAAGAQDDGAPRMKGSLGVALGVARVQPASAELSPRTAVRPSLRRVPARGFGVAFAFNWFDTDVGGAFAAVEGPFGRLAVRSVMVGIGYTVMHGRVAITPSIVAGPALASLDLDERVEDRFRLADSVERNVGRFALATRAGVSATYVLAPRLGLSGSGGYLWNRPAFTLESPSGVARRTLRADSVVLEGGVVVWLF